MTSTNVEYESTKHFRPHWQILCLPFLNFRPGGTKTGSRKNLKRKKPNMSLFTGRFLMHAKVYLGKIEDNLRLGVQLGSGDTHF